MRTKIITLIVAIMLATTYVAGPVQPARPAGGPGSAPVSRPAGNYAVQTDYAGLTPYTPPELASRLTPGPMPELVPSGSYGPLVPYVGALIYSEYDGWYSKYGLATTSGTLVTDAVYEWVYLNSNPSGSRSVYNLSKAGGEGGYYIYYSVCAENGSWCLPFEYNDIVLHENVILATRMTEGPSEYNYFNIDVYDYSGTLLYNILDLAFIDMLDRDDPYMMLLYAAGDIVAVKLAEGGVGYLDLPSGVLNVTDFESARQFSEGLAAVRINGRWGFLDESFRFALEPAYIWATDFSAGRSIVLFEGGSWNAVIDTTGTELFSVKLDNNMGELYYQYDGMGYYLTSADGDIVTYFTWNFGSIPSVIDGVEVEYLGDGWYMYRNPGCITLISPENEWYELPGVEYVVDVSGDLVIYANADYGYGIMTLYGEDIVPVSGDCYYIYEASHQELYIAYTDTGLIVYRPDGSVFAHIPDSMELVETTHGMLGAVDRDSFYYLDQNGSVTFRVSLWGYLPD